jgi:hypothetical protein
MILPDRASAASVARRVVSLHLLLAVCVSLAATQRVTVTLVASVFVCWLVVPFTQLVAATVFVRSAPGRPASMTVALDRLFAAHGPWSGWLVLVAAASMVTGNLAAIPLSLLLASALVPLVWTGMLLHRYATGVLGLSGTRAVVQVAVHQAVVWGIAFVFAAWAVALTPRLAGSAG